ncbi:hypothetical protein RHGRI_001411 [Rhododendron griersonianum]|uniref:Uncharacterized protein n=1 Tax=Rhododendron griersonianum TaxID=479676 RepID=A0AAV6LK37_9ERIC|nr:hypothetical protein RHGRI_001411 [Rhododendron griersonianum]
MPVGRFGRIQGLCIRRTDCAGPIVPDQAHSPALAIDSDRSCSAMELGVEIQEEPNSASDSEEVQKVQGMDEDICDLTHLFETMDLEVFLLERDDERLPEQTTTIEFVESIGK